jgi:hypothetical protein
MRTSLGCLGIFLIILAFCASDCLAWSYKEHILFTRLAVARLLDDPSTPQAMKAWLRDVTSDVPDMAAAEEFFMHAKIGIKPRGISGLSYWAYEPDEHALYDKAAVKIEPFGVHEKFLHYIDLELLKSGDARRAYKHDLSGKAALNDFPHDMKDQRYVQAGMLPFRIEYCYRQLVDSIRNKALNARNREEQEEKTAIYWAGYLSHYLADCTQPQHATMDYKSQTYFADQRRSPNIHAEVEYRMCDDEQKDYMDLRQEFWPMFVKQLNEFKDPVETKDIWQSSLEVSWHSYDALPLIGLAAMKATNQAGTPDHPTGAASPVDTEVFFRFRGQYMGREMSVMEMKAIQTAWAVKRIQKVYRMAWDEASK